MAALNSLLGAAVKPVCWMLRIALLFLGLCLSLFWMPVRWAIRLFWFFLRLFLLFLPPFLRPPRLQHRRSRHGFWQSAGIHEATSSQTPRTRDWQLGSWHSVGFLWVAGARGKGDGLWKTGGLVWVADTGSHGGDAWRSSGASGVTDLGRPEINLGAWFASPDCSATGPSLSSSKAPSSRIPRPCVVQPRSVKAAVYRDVFLTRSHGSQTTVLLPCEPSPARRSARKAGSSRRGRRSRFGEAVMATSSDSVRWSVLLGRRPCTRASRIPVWSSRSSSS